MGLLAWWRRWRSSASGKFVTKDQAKAEPGSTYGQRVPRHRDTSKPVEPKR